MVEICNAAGLDKGQSWALRMAIDKAMLKDLLGDVWKLRNQQSNANDGGKHSLAEAVKILYTKGKKYAAKLYQRTYFDVAKTPSLMKELGLTGERFTIRFGVISRHFGKDSDHKLPVEIWEQLPESLKHPFAITKHFERKGDKRIEKGFRIYTTLQHNDKYVIVGADVKSAGKNLEINAIEIAFAITKPSELEEILYTSKKITPEQQSLLDRRNSYQYPAEREVSEGKGSGLSGLGKTVRPKDGGRVTVAADKSDKADKPVFSIDGNAEGNQEAYDAAKGLVESAGLEVVEVSDAEARAMLDGRGEARLMGSRTDKKMAKVSEHYADRELDSNTQAVVDVFSGKADNIAIEVERSDGKQRVIMRQGREPKAGTKHSLYRHFETRSNYITADDIAMIPEIIAKGERTVNGKKVTYDYVAEDGAMLRVTTEIRKNGHEEFTNLISNRKPQTSEYRQAQEGNTQLSARTTEVEVSDAKLENNAETDKSDSGPLTLRTFKRCGREICFEIGHNQK